LYLEFFSHLNELTLSTYVFYFRLQHYVKRIKFQWLVYIPPGLTSNILGSANRVHLMCFIWLWKQRAVISLCTVHWLVFVRQNKGTFTARYELNV
jgi:hypothetical protein